MRWKSSWVDTWRNASREKICGVFLCVTAMPNCASFLQARWSRLSRAICLIRLAACRTQREGSVTSLFPMFMKLQGRQCLVVGAGRIGEPKIGGLLGTGARIRVVALEASPAVREWAREGKLELELRAFSADDLDGAFLAVVATN